MRVAAKVLALGAVGGLQDPVAVAAAKTAKATGSCSCSELVALSVDLRPSDFVLPAFTCDAGFSLDLTVAQGEGNFSHAAWPASRLAAQPETESAARAKQAIHWCEEMLIE